MGSEATKVDAYSVDMQKGMDGATAAWLKHKLMEAVELVVRLTFVCQKPSTAFQQLTFDTFSQQQDSALLSADWIVVNCIKRPLSDIPFLWVSIKVHVVYLGQASEDPS